MIGQFHRRGQITYEHMHDRGSYGVSRFDSHAGREIVFLALIAFTFYEQIPEARTWLEWLRPVLCGIWPIWAGDDGAWAEGPSYGLAYVRIMTAFATALKRGAGVDLYRRPFWRNHAEWRRWCLPPYAEWIGFGDHTERWASTWRANADLVELIDAETGAVLFEEGTADENSERIRRACPFNIPRQGADGRLFKCVMCVNRVRTGELPACAKACPSDAIEFGDRSALINKSYNRVATLKQRGFADANLYGEHELGGLHQMYVLTDRPAVYGLPESPQVATRNVVGTWLSGVLTAGVVAVVPFWLLFKRKQALAAERISEGGE